MQFGMWPEHCARANFYGGSMKRRTQVAVVFLLIVLSSLALAQSNELGVVGGATFSPDFHTGATLQANYAHRMIDAHAASLYLELPVVGVFSRHVPNTVFVSQDFSSIFFTPSAKIKLAPSSVFSPFVSVGGGFAHFNTDFATRTTPFSVGSFNDSNTTWAVQVGGGVDVKTPIPALAIRLEARDFITGLPAPSAGQRFSHHNVAPELGVVFRF
jgi:hypothetical protein